MIKLVGGSSQRPTSPNPVPGTSRKAGEKRRGDVDALEDVPSDESDEDRRVLIKRPRLRQRPNQNYKKRRPSGGLMSPFQEKIMELTLARRPSSSSIGSETPVKKSAVSAADADPESITPRQADPSTPVRGYAEGEPIAGYSGGNGRQVRRNILADSKLRRPKKSVISVNDENGWTLFSLWMPSWKAKLKCDNGSLTVEPNDLGKEVLEVVETVVPFIAHYKEHQLKLFQVQSTEEDGSGDAKIMLKQYLASLPETGSIRFKSSDVAVAKFLAKIVSTDDVIIQFKPIPSETYIPGVIIHLTTRVRQKITDDLRQLFKSENVHVNIHDSSDLPYPYDWEKLLEIRSASFQWPGHAKKKRSFEAACNKVAATSNSNGSSDGSTTGVILIDLDDSDDELMTTSNREVKGNFEFNLEQFARESVFLPGPMRPKLEKGPTNNYLYHRLGELAEMLSNSLAKDSKNRERNVISGLIKHQCHTYGVVAKVIKEHRHSENAYLIRIADETMNSVLLRLHTISSFGPVVEVGDIIRIHRLTVQIEWDSEHAGNTMVLSTSQHFNYVLFRECPDTEDTFNYHTCAKSITLGDFDKMRVGELSHFKKNKNAREAEVEELPPNDLPNTPQNHNLRTELVVRCNGSTNANLDEVSNSSGTDGICSDDLVSPRVSDACSINNCSLQQSPELFSDAQINNCPRVASCTDSDDSYVTAVASPNMELQNQNVNQTSVDELPLISPDDDLEETLQSGASLHLGRQGLQGDEEAYTCFMNLKKNGSKPTLLCTIAELLTTSEKNMCYLIIKDGESTLPVEDFKNRDFLGDQRGDSHLVLNITNAKQLVVRGIFSELFDSLGANELYIIEDVEIQGENPPYSLEVNGDTCVIRLATYEDLSRNLNQPFTLQTPMSGAITVSPVQARKQTARNSTGSDASGKNIGEARPSSGVSGSSASATPGSSPGTSRNEDKPWDGKVTTRRMRRHHYQPEDDLEC